MKFSVITITRNAKKYVDQCISSVAGQDYGDVEHLFWDGGSTDGTLEVLQNSPSIHLHRGEDGGIADAMNKGAALATGEVLLFLHADDRLPHSQILSMVARAFKTHPQTQWLYGRAAIIDSKGFIKRTTPLEFYSKKRLERYNFLTHPAVYVTRSLFEEVGGFDRAIRYCMDYDLWFRLARTTSPLLLAAALAEFREHEGSLSISSPREVADEAFRVRSRYIKGPLAHYRSRRTWRRRR